MQDSASELASLQTRILVTYAHRLRLHVVMAVVAAVVMRSWAVMAEMVRDFAGPVLSMFTI
jgi:hypothetical protein